MVETSFKDRLSEPSNFMSPPAETWV